MKNKKPMFYEKLPHNPYNPSIKHMKGIPPSLWLEWYGFDPQGPLSPFACSKKEHERHDHRRGYVGRVSYKNSLEYYKMHDT